MNWKQLKPYAVGIAGVEAVGLFASVISRQGIEEFNTVAAQPTLTPPQWVFPVVWTVLYALMGVSAVRIWQAPPSKERSGGLNLFVVQLILNFFWTLIFFNAKAYGLAAVWIVILWTAVLAMILRFRKVDMTAAWLQVPYLIWLTFATYLTFGVWALNG